MRLFLFRHADPVSSLRATTDGVVLDEENGLSREGVRQARSIASFLAGQDVSAPLLYSSPIRRSIETANIAAEHLGTAIRLESRLEERRVRLSSRLTIEQHNRAQIRSYLAPADSIDGSESVAAHRARAVSFYREVVEPLMAEDTTMIVFSHGGTIEHLLGCVLGSVNNTLSGYFIAMPCAHYHLIRSVAPSGGRMVWRVERISASPVTTDLR